jgi:hypothetical protein
VITIGLCGWNTAAKRGLLADPVAAKITGPKPSNACLSKVCCHCATVIKGKFRCSGGGFCFTITAAYTGAKTSP